MNYKTYWDPLLTRYSTRVSGQGLRNPSVIPVVICKFNDFPCFTSKIGVNKILPRLLAPQCYGIFLKMFGAQIHHLNSLAIVVKNFTLDATKEFNLS